jgi:hypothetical protein
MGARIFWKPWPTGTTANIAVTFGASHADGTTQHICVYRVTGASGTASAESAVGDTDADPISSGAITIPTGGGCIGVAVFAVDTTARTWTGITEDPSVDEDAGTFRFTTGTSTTAGTPTITVSGGNNEDGALAWLILKPGGTITVEAGSYTYTGTAASLERGRKVVADAGSYTYTGTDATLRVGHPLSAGAGSYTYTGSDASLEVGYKVVAGAGSYTYTGTDASLEVGHRLNARLAHTLIAGPMPRRRSGTKFLLGPVLILTRVLM